MLELWYETKVYMCATYDPDYDGVFDVRQLHEVLNTCMYTEDAGLLKRT